MLGSVGLWRVVTHRARAEWPVEAAAFLLLLCATTLLATGALYSDTVTLGGLRRAFLDADPVARSVLVRTTSSAAAVAATDEAVGPEIRRALESAGGETALVVRSASLSPAGMDPTEAPRNLTRLAAYEGIADHADLLSGRWPIAGRSPVEAALSEGAAAELGLAVGQKLTLAAGIGGGTTVPVEVVGVWSAHRDDAYWLGDPLELDGIARAGELTTRGPFVVARDDLARAVVPGSLELQWRGLPDPDGLRVEAIGELGRDVAGLADRVHALPGLRDATVSSGLPEILAAVERAILVSRSTVTLLTIQFAVLAGYAVLLVGGMMIDRRRAQAALLRSRGATTGHLAALSLGEAILLAIPAVILAPIAAVGLVRLIGSLGPLAGTDVAARVGITQGAVLAALIAGIGSVFVLTLPALSLGGPIAGVRAGLGRQVGRTLAHRLGLDLVLVAVAVVALWQLSLYGAPITRNARGVLGLDPLLVAAPAIGLLAGAVVATRLVPRLAEIGERMAGRRRGVVSPLGTRQLARRPLRYTRSALLLILAAALGTFAAASAATWTRSQADQAAYRAAADVRVSLADYPSLPSWGTGSAFRDVPGVSAVSPVVRTTVDVGRTVRDGQLLAIDPSAARRLLTYPPGATGQGLPALVDQLLADRPTTAGVAIPGEPARLSVTVDADLDGDPGFNSEAVAPDWPGLGVAVVVRDGDGRLHRLSGAPGTLVGKGQRIDIPLSATVDGVTVRPIFPLTLEAVEIEVAPPLNIPILGTADVTGVAASGATTGADLTPVGWDPAALGWDWFRDDQNGTRAYRPPTGAPGRLEIGTGSDARSGPAFGTSEKPAAMFRSLAAPGGDGVVPVIASELYLERTGARVGDTTTATTPAGPLTFRIIGSATAFPPLDPSVPFLVADVTTLETADFAATGYPLVTKEWWLATDPARTNEVLTAVAGPPYGVASSVGRAALARSLATDPVPLGVLGALALGSIASLVFAGVGFVAGATLSASERRGEFALLRALGLSERQLSGQLSIESGFLLAVGLGGGTILGLVLAWLVLPYATLSVDGSAVVPPPTIVVPWEAILPLYGLLAILLVGTVLVMSRQVPGDRISGVLRATDG